VDEPLVAPDYNELAKELSADLERLEYLLVDYYRLQAEQEDAVVYFKDCVSQANKRTAAYMLRLTAAHADVAKLSSKLSKAKRKAKRVACTSYFYAKARE
jgi:ribosomal 50S subunit-associated protein YjgA (DUF615 family)